MNFKENWKRFWTLDRHHAAGFTLVELIVVIAILAILAGVAVPAYSGYVTQANKQADMSLVADVEQALILYYYSHPEQMQGSVAVALTPDGAAAANNAAAAAMAATFGENWATTLKLQHNDWGTAAALNQEILNYFVNGDYDDELAGIFDGSTEVSFKESINELFDQVEETATWLGNATQESGAALVGNAADITTSIDKGTYNSGADRFASLWSASVWQSDFFMDGTGEEYDQNAGTLTGNALDQAIANAAVLKARNTAVGAYLRNQGCPNAAALIENFVYTGTSIPRDGAGDILNGGTDEIGFEAQLSVAEQEKAALALAEYFGLDGRATSSTQAYADGLAYYAMMNTVNELDNSTNLDKSDDEAYWNDLSSAVELYAAIANGQASLTDLNGQYATLTVENGIVITILSNGKCHVSPNEANPE